MLIIFSEKNHYLIYLIYLKLNNFYILNITQNQKSQID